MESFYKDIYVKFVSLHEFCKTRKIFETFNFFKIYMDSKNSMNLFEIMRNSKIYFNFSNFWKKKILYKRNWKNSYGFSKFNKFIWNIHSIRAKATKTKPRVRVKARWNTSGVSLLLRRERHWSYLSCTLLHWEGVSHCLKATERSPPLSLRDLRRALDLWRSRRQIRWFRTWSIDNILHGFARNKILFHVTHVGGCMRGGGRGKITLDALLRTLPSP